MRPVYVAISFLIERGIIDKRTRRSPLTSLTDDVYAGQAKHMKGQTT